MTPAARRKTETYADGVTSPVGSALDPGAREFVDAPAATQVTGAAVAALAVGALAAVAGTTAHQAVLEVGEPGGPGGLVIPVGVVVALLLSALTQATVVALASGLPSRRAVAAVALAGIAGWAAVVVAATVTGPGGDLLVVANGRGTCWVVGGLLLLAVVSGVVSRLVGPSPERYGPDGHRG